MLALLRTALAHDDGPVRDALSARTRCPRRRRRCREIDAGAVRHVGSRWRVHGGAKSRFSRSARWCCRRSQPAETLAAEGLDVSVVNCRFLKPYDELTLAAVMSRASQAARRRGRDRRQRIRSVHGVGRSASYDPDVRVAVHGVPDRIIYAASRARQLASCGLDATGIAARVRALHESEALTG